MPAPKGNEYWRYRSSQGRPPKYSSPDELRQQCRQYFTMLAEVHQLKVKAAQACQGVAPHSVRTSLRALQKGIRVNPATWLKYQEIEGFREVIIAAEEAVWSGSPRALKVF